MRLAKVYGAKFATLSFLPLTALHQLAAHSTPAAVRDEIMARVAGGERLTASAIKAIINEAKQPKADDGTTEEQPGLPDPQPPADTGSQQEDPSVHSSEAAQAAADIIMAACAGATLNRLVELLERVDPNEVKQAILIRVAEQRDAMRASGQQDTEGSDGAQRGSLPMGNGESVGPALPTAHPIEAASLAPEAGSDNTDGKALVTRVGSIEANPSSSMPDLPPFLDRRRSSSLGSQTTGGEPVRS